MLKADSFKVDYQSLSLKEKIFIGLIVLDLLLLLFLGRVYTKNSFYSHLYFHDTILFATFFFSLTFKSGFRLKSIELLGIISLVYLAISILFEFNPNGDLYVYLRQFMTFGYLIQCYFIFKAVAGIKIGLKTLLQLISLLAILAIVVQFLYVLYIFFSVGENPFLERNYFSPLTVLSVIVATALGLVYLKGYKKFLYFIFVFALSFSFGHDSAYLAVIMVLLFYYFLNSRLKIRILIAILAILGLIALLLFVSTFSDGNVNARLFFWLEILSKSLDNFSIFYGNGFGKPYLSFEAAEKLNKLVLVFRDPESIFIIAPHNSFITMLYHLGVSVLLLFFPLSKLFSKGKLLKVKSTIFLLLSLIGASVWASFNVILELPHSSTYFWLIYFTLAFYLHKNSVDERKKTV